MARFFAPNLFIFLSLILLSLLPSTALAAIFKPPEVPEAPEVPEVPIDPTPEPVDPPLHPDPGFAPEAPSAPFSEPESEPAEDGGDLEDLADKIEDLIDSILSLLPSSSSSSALSTTANPNAAAASSTVLPTTTRSPNATLACEIYQAYTSLCPPVKISPSTETVFLGQLFTQTVDASEASAESATARASCLCYSSAYYVPVVYDDARWACAAYAADGSNPTVAAVATAAAAQKDHFCSSIGNVRITASSASFGQFTRAAVTASTPTATPTGSAGGGEVTSAAGRLLGGGARIWAFAAVMALAAILL